MSVLNKRLMKELKAFQSKPVDNCMVEPREDNFTLWDCVINAKIEGKGNGKGVVECPLHFLVQFPPEYPSKAPSVGFTTTFPYDDGASYVINDTENPLNGKYVICLDLLGNFAHVHTEWAEVAGSGWSPAYDISSLLVVLQSVVLENISRTTSVEVSQIRQKCLAQNQTLKPFPDILLMGEASSSSSSSPPTCLNGKSVDEVPSLCVDFSRSKISVPASIQAQCHLLSRTAVSADQKAAIEAVLRFFVLGETAAVIDPDIYCWHSKVPSFLPSFLPSLPPSLSPSLPPSLLPPKLAQLNPNTSRPTTQTLCWATDCLFLFTATGAGSRFGRRSNWSFNYIYSRSQL